MNAENIASTGIRSKDCLTHSKSLYRLSYLSPQTRIVRVIQSRRIGWAVLVTHMGNEEFLNILFRIADRLEQHARSRHRWSNTRS